MDIHCSCGIVHKDLVGHNTSVCSCGNQLTGIFGLRDRNLGEEIRTNIRTSMLSGLVSNFTTEELLDEVKRRLSDAK